MLSDVFIVRKDLDLWAVSNLARSDGLLKILKPSRSD